MGYSPWDRGESDTTEHTHTHKGKHINSYFIVENPGRRHLNQKPQVNITSINMTKVVPGGEVSIKYLVI